MARWSRSLRRDDAGVMEAFGVAADNRKFRRFDVSRRHYRGRTVSPSSPTPRPPAILRRCRRSPGAAMTVEGLGAAAFRATWPSANPRADGLPVNASRTASTVAGGPLRGVDVDMNAISDTVQTLAGGRPVRRRRSTTSATSPTSATRRPTGSPRWPSSCESSAPRSRSCPTAWGSIRPPTELLHGAEIDTYDDHRMAMSLAMAGLRIPGVMILDPGCTAKTYPGFWDDLERPPDRLAGVILLLYADSTADSLALGSMLA